MTTVQTQSSTRLLSDRNYGVVTKAATLVLPLLGALYFGLAQIWGLPAAEQVVGTIALLNAFAGGLSAVAKKIYDVSGGQYDGQFQVDEHEDGATLRLVSVNPDALDTKDVLSFKIRR